jgi:hypothetical protein
MVSSIKRSLGSTSHLFDRVCADKSAASVSMRAMLAVLCDHSAVSRMAVQRH